MFVSPHNNSAKKNDRTNTGELSEYKQRKIGEFGLGYYLSKILRLIKK